MTYTSETFRLCHGYAWDDVMSADSIRAHVFGHLADLAWPVVEHYRSDLFHDAAWLRDYVNGPITFYFGVRETGTSIGTDRECVDAFGPDDPLYRVEITSTDTDRHDMTITREK